jgi:D-alanyl-lipoteichoic acid acyltransferase DltB (MBOAT superfamily)
MKLPSAPSDYSFLWYFVYVNYVPLYFGGPIVTFNSWISQFRSPPSNVTLRSVTWYAIRLLGAILLMEIMLHSFLVMAISRARAFHGLTPVQLTSVGYWNLKFIWLKVPLQYSFLVINKPSMNYTYLKSITKCSY